jgi:hypothetical protein
VKGREPLDDIGMHILPPISFAWADGWFLIWVPFSVIRLMIFFDNGLIMFIRNFVVYGTVLFFRALFLNLSILPDPNPGTCAHTERVFPPPPFVVFSLCFLTFTVSECLHYVPHTQMYAPFDLSCGDMMYSGHTALWVRNFLLSSSATALTNLNFSSFCYPPRSSILRSF